MRWTKLSRTVFCFSVFIALGVLATGCHRGKGLTGEGAASGWTLEMDAHPDTVAVGDNDTIFVVVRQGGEPQGGITVSFEQTLGDSIPTVVTIIDDPDFPWGTWPMATFISRQDPGVATIYGEAYRSEEEVLARDTVTIWVVGNP